MARLVLNQKTGRPVTTGYISMLRDKGLRGIRYMVTHNRAEKHPSGIPVKIGFWVISNRSKRLLVRMGAETVDQVLCLNFQHMNGSPRRELLAYLEKHGLVPAQQAAA